MKFTFLFAICLAATTTAQTSTWTQQTVQVFPAPRANTALAYDSAHGQVVLFGGFSASGTYLGDTWVWNGSAWSQKSPQNSPPARLGHAMVYDSVRGQVVLFGGYGAGGDASDTWTWDGTNWTSQSSSSVPPPGRTLHTMVFDTARAQTVLFGGYSSSGGFYNDTWVWNGLTWAQKQATGPGARADATMAYDSVHSQTVLTGGETAAQTLATDTWTWNGSSWSQQSPAASPPARYGAAMAFDAAVGKTILFGGWDVDQVFNDTWAFDGTNWTQQSAPVNPVPRHDCSMAYDSTHMQVVMYGGIDPIYTYGDTWTWQAAAASTGPAITNVISASAFGAFTAAAPGSWVEIYGSNLAPDSRSWTTADFNVDTAPVSLDGVQVTIGGQKAAVAYISSTQVNAQIPSNVATGKQQLTVTSANQTSAAYNLTIASNQPGLLAPPSFQVGGKQYLVALLPDNVTYILPTGAIAGLTSRPAHPGETIILYGVGFGPVTPSIASGQIVTESNQLGSTLQVMFGGVSAQVAYDGLAPGFVGLYQFNIVVPQVPDNNLVPITFTLAGVPGTQTLYSAVQQ